MANHRPFIGIQLNAPLSRIVARAPAYAPRSRRVASRMRDHYLAVCRFNCTCARTRNIHGPWTRVSHHLKDARPYVRASRVLQLCARKSTFDGRSRPARPPVIRSHYVCALIRDPSTSSDLRAASSSSTPVDPSAHLAYSLKRIR